MGSLTRVLSEAYYTLKSLTRYKGVLFWTVVFPILLYALMVGIFGGSGYTRVAVGVVVLDEGLGSQEGDLSLGQTLVQAMNDSTVFTVEKYDSIDELVDAVRHGSVDVGLVVPDGFTANITAMRPGRVEVIVLETQWGDYYLNIVQGFLQGFSDEARSRAIEAGMNYTLQYVPRNISGLVEAYYRFIESPLEVDVERYQPPLLSTSGGVKAYYAIGVIGIEVLFIGLSIGVNSFIEMKRDGTLRVLLASPMRSWEIVASQTISALLAVAVSAASIFLFSLALGAHYEMDAAAAATTILLLLAGTLFTIGFGLLLAPLARSPEAAMAIVNSIAFPIMFIGGLTVPTFILPDTLKAFAQVYPLSLTIEAIRGMTTYSRTPLWALHESLPAMAATIVVYVLGLYFMNKLIARAAEE